MILNFNEINENTIQLKPGSFLPAILFVLKGVLFIGKRFLSDNQLMETNISSKKENTTWKKALQQGLTFKSRYKDLIHVQFNNKMKAT